MFRQLIKSKTVWTGIGLIIAAVYMLIAGESSASDAMTRIMEGCGLIFLRSGIFKTGEQGS